jgi:hypothetical protein
MAFKSVTTAVANTNSNVLLSDVTSVQSWVLGLVYNETTRTWSKGGDFEQLRELSLLGDLNGLPNIPYFERARPSYTSNTVTDFVHLKDYTTGMISLLSDTRKRTL